MLHRAYSQAVYVVVNCFYRLVYVILDSFQIFLTGYTIEEIRQMEKRA